MYSEKLRWKTNQNKLNEIFIFHLKISKINELYYVIIFVHVEHKQGIPIITVYTGMQYEI